jgi:tripartite-type tricarboxylate transporter receptor subunit TctC
MKKFLASALALGLLASGSGFAPEAAAQQARTVRLVVPFAAGQGSDILARTLSNALSVIWKQTVVVDNKPGANGIIALQEVIRSAPDGTTLLFTSNSPIVINPSVYKQLPYNVERDLKPVVLVARADLALIVNPNFPAKTWREVADTIKANPGKFSYGSPGLGSTSNLSMEVFKQEIGGDVTHVPYKGSGPALTDLMGGSLHLMIDALPSTLPHIKSGRVRAIGLTSSKPSSFAPELPTAVSAGFPDLPQGGWYGIFAPAGTPDAAVERLYEDIRGVVGQEDIQQRLREQALEPVTPPLGPARFAEFVRSDSQYWVKQLRRLGTYQRE